LKLDEFIEKLVAAVIVVIAIPSMTGHFEFLTGHQALKGLKICKFFGERHIFVVLYLAC
jgi:hypothetical protein